MTTVNCIEVFPVLYRIGNAALLIKLAMSLDILVRKRAG